MSHESSPRPRQLVICCDGTNNNLTGGANDTHVVKLAQLLAASADGEQVLFYDPGVGNPGELPGATYIDKWNRVRARIAGLAFGRGVYENLAQCYAFLMRHYQPGDAIYIFGFSRGAFTARSLAGLVNQFGILRPHADAMLETLMHVYFSERRSEAAKFQAICRQLTNTFADPPARAVEVEFIGVWDTVASVGLWPFHERISAVPTASGKRFRHVRQALALDEHRAQFKPRLYAENNGRYQTVSGHLCTLEQRWFRGSHSDVGGGYGPTQTGISREAMAWIVSEAVRCGLRLADDQGPLDSETAVLDAHDRLTGLSSAPAPRVHSMLRNNPLWALTGMAVRDTRRVTVHGAPDVTVQPQAHASVARMDLRFPQDTVWAQPSPHRWLVAAMLVMPLLVLLAGWLLQPMPALAGFGAQLWHALTHAGSYFAACGDFALWQLSWWIDGRLAEGLQLFDSPRWALAADLPLIAAYAYVLSWWAVRGFAWRAGLRQVGAPPDRWLAVLGWALPLAVIGDLAENLATWATLTALGVGRPHLAALLGGLMTLCALAKCLGLAGTLVLAIPPRPWARRAPEVRNSPA